MTASVEFDDEEDLKSPSTALKMGYDLKRLVGAKWGLALRREDEASARECKNFLKLYKLEWNVKISKLASVVLQTRHYNKEQSLPEPEDLVKLQNYTKEKIRELDLSDSSYQNFRFAEIISQTRLLLYNKRRSGELEVVSSPDQEVLKIFDLSDQQQTWLTNQLGHTTDIHRIHYRQTSGVLERIDIAKIMLLQEFNITSKFAGKKLEDIHIPGIVFGEGKEPDAAELAPVDCVLPQMTEEADDPDYQPNVFQNDEHDIYEFGDDAEEERLEETGERKTGKGSQRVKWPTKEEDEIKLYFKDNFETKTTPGKLECELAIKTSQTNNGVLHRINWETLKKKVWNMIKKC